jgi:hypothetical protein
MHPGISSVINDAVTGLQETSDEKKRAVLQLLNTGSLNPAWPEAAFELLQCGELDVIRNSILNQRLTVLLKVFEILSGSEA